MPEKTVKLPASGGSYVRDARGGLKKAEPAKPSPSKPAKED